MASAPRPGRPLRQGLRAARDLSSSRYLRLQSAVAEAPTSSLSLLRSLICAQDNSSAPPLAAASGKSLKAQILALNEWGVLRRKGVEGGWILDPKMVRSEKEADSSLSCNPSLCLRGARGRPESLSCPQRTFTLCQVEVGAASGSGSFGSVKRALWRGADVVVKEVRVEALSEAVSCLREVEVRLFC